MSAPVAIVTDSTSDLDDGLRERHGIDVVPLFVAFGVRSYRDGVELGRDAFYARLQTETELPTTSQPTPAMFEETFRPHVAAGRTVIVLTIMAALSGTLNAAHAAAAAFPPGSVHVVDSGSVSAGLAQQAVLAAELAAAGADAPAILAALERVRPQQRGYATIPDLSHAVRTGRVSRTAAFVGSLVRIVPVLRIDGGRIAEEARVRTFARAQTTMIESALREAAVAREVRVGVVHTRAPELAASLAQQLASALPEAARPVVLEAGPVIATHAGPGAIGIFVLPQP